MDKSILSMFDRFFLFILFILCFFRVVQRMERHFFWTFILDPPWRFANFIPKLKLRFAWLQLLGTRGQLFDVSQPFDGNISSFIRLYFLTRSNLIRLLISYFLLIRVINSL